MKQDNIKLHVNTMMWRIAEPNPLKKEIKLCYAEGYHRCH